MAIENQPVQACPEFVEGQTSQSWLRFQSPHNLKVSKA